MKFRVSLPGRLGYPQILLVAGLLFSWWLLDFQSLQLAPGAGNKSHRPDFWATGFSTLALDVDGKPSYRLAAHRTEHFRDDGSSEFDHPDYLRFREDQGPVTITALSSWSNEDGSQMVLVGDVVIISEGNESADGVTATMDELLLYPDDDFAETSSPVKIISPAGITTGVGMHLNSRTGTLVLLSNVRGIYEASQ